jgi:hypothetical protein
VEAKNGAKKPVEKDAELKEDNYNDLANIIILHIIYNMLTTKNLAAHTKKTKDKQIKDLEQQLNNLEKLYYDTATNQENDVTQIQKEYSEIEAVLSKIKKHRSVKKYVDDDSHEPTAMRRWLYKPMIKKEKHTLRTASTVLEKEKKKKPLRTRSDPVTSKEGKLEAITEGEKLTDEQEQKKKVDELKKKKADERASKPRSSFFDHLEPNTYLGLGGRKSRKKSRKPKKKHRRRRTRKRKRKRKKTKRRRRKRKHKRTRKR